MLLSVPLMSAADYERGSQQSRLCCSRCKSYTTLSSRVVFPFSELVTTLETPPGLAGTSISQLAKNIEIASRHHRALAGGTSISQLSTNYRNRLETPPRFSRWYFNFTAIDKLSKSPR